MESHPELTILIPVYRNADTLQPLHRRLSETLVGQQVGYEILFVEDACPQDSLAVLKELACRDPHVSILALSHNVGQQHALLAGLLHLRSQTVVIMDADLQDPPEAIPALLDRLNDGFEVVFAGRRGKYESGGRLLTSKLYKGVLHVLTGIPADAGVFLAARQPAVEKLLNLETTRLHSIVAALGITGLRMTSIPVERAGRQTGQSAYTSRMRLQIGLRTVCWALGWRLGFRSPMKLASRRFPMLTYVGARFDTKEEQPV